MAEVFSLFLFCSFIHYDNNINIYQYIGLFLFFFPSNIWVDINTVLLYNAPRSKCLYKSEQFCGNRLQSDDVI